MRICNFIQFTNYLAQENCNFPKYIERNRPFEIEGDRERERDREIERQIERERGRESVCERERAERKGFFYSDGVFFFNIFGPKIGRSPIQ